MKISLRHKFFKRMLLAAVLSSYSFSLSAEVDSPVIDFLNPTYEGVFLNGYSSIEITAPEGCRIEYTINDVTSTSDGNKVVIDNLIKDEYNLSATAVNSAGERSEAADITFNAEAIKFNNLREALLKWVQNNTYANRLNINGYVEGPFRILEVSEINDFAPNYSNPNWMILENEKLSDGVNPKYFIVEFPSGKDIPEHIKPGKRIDYIKIQFGYITSDIKLSLEENPYYSTYKTKKMPVTICGDWMYFSTYEDIAPSSEDCEEYIFEEGFPESFDWVNDASIYLKPYVFKNVKVTDGKVGYLAIANEFKKYNFEFEPDQEYDIYGIRGVLNNKDNGEALYVTRVVKLSEDTPETVFNIDSAFENIGLDKTKVQFDCKLTVAIINSARTHIFAYDEYRDFITLVGDYNGSDINPGDNIENLTASIWLANGMRYAEADNIAFTTPENVSKPVAERVEIENIADHVGKLIYVETNLAINDDSQPISRTASSLPEITIGDGIRINPYAMNDDVADSFADVVNAYEPDKKYKITGVLAHDEDGEPEFWASALDEADQKLINGIDDVIQIGSYIDCHLASLPKDSEIFDIYGRKTSADRVTNGIYLIRHNGKTVKVFVK